MNRLKFVCGLAALAMLFVCPSAFAASISSNGTGGGDWNATGTWTGGVVPNSGDNVVIAAGDTVTVTDNQSASTVDIGAGAGGATLQVNAGGTLTVVSTGTALKVTAPSATGTALLQLAGGTLNVTSGDILVDGNASAVARISFSAAGGTITVAGSLTFGATPNSQVDFAAAGNVNIGGTLGANGTITSTTSTFTFNGTSAQAINGPYTFYNLTINKASGIAQMFASNFVNGNLDVLNGTLDDAGNQITLNGGGTSQVNIGGSGILKLGAGAITTTFPAPVSGGNVNIAAGGTVIYQSSLAQSVNTDVIYSNLTITNSGAPVIHTMSGLTLNVNQTLTVANNGANVTTFDVADNAVLANGDIAGNGTINVDAGVIDIQGNWGSSSTLSAGSSTITYYGTNAQFVRGTTYYNLVINKSAGVATLSGAATVAGDFTISDGTFHSQGHTFHVDGLFSNAGVFDASASVVVFEGAVSNTNSALNSLDFDSATVKLDKDLVASRGLQPLGVSGQLVSSASPVTIANLHVDGTAGVTLSGDFSITGSLALNAGNLNVGNSLFIDVLATVTQSSGWITGPLTMGLNPAPARRYHVGTSSVYLPVDIDSGSAGTVTVEAKDGKYGSSTGDNVLDAYWELAAGTATPLDNLQFTYAQSLVNDGDETKYRLARHNGSFTAYGTSANVDETNNTASATNVSTYVGNWVIGQHGSTGSAGALAITSINGGLNPKVNVPFDVDVESRYDDGTTAANVTLTTTVDILRNAGTGSLLTSSANINAGTSTATVSNLSYDTAESGVTLKAVSAAGDDLTEFESAPFTVDPAPSTLTVTSLADSGAGTLRDAIETHNAGGCTTPCTINFTGISGQINLLSLLPTIVVDDLLIDGFTANGASANTAAFGQPSDAVITMAIDGSSGVAVGFEVAAGDVDIRGFAVQNFNNGGTGVGVRYSGDSAGSQISGCYIGTNMAGNAAAPNGTGLIIESAELAVGGTTPADRMLISGNVNTGLNVGATSNTVSVAGAYIGTNAGLTGSLPNTIGVYVGASTTGETFGNAGIGNVVSGNSSYGFYLEGSGATLMSNIVGLAGSGSTAMANGAGVMLSSTATNNTLGGPSPSDTNYISGNLSNGIRVEGSGNTIDLTYVGVATNGTTVVGNGGNGILIAGNAANNLIGTTYGNTIRGNNGDGVSLTTTGRGNVIRKKNIYGNTGLAIDLGDNGATANDATDSDTGPNNLQNFPAISDARISGANLNVTFSMNSSGSVGTTHYVFDFYKSDNSSPTPAYDHIGDSGCMAGNVFSNAAVSIGVGTAVVGDTVTATATGYSDAACTTPSEGTSELSPVERIAGDIHWNNASGGSWETAGNWLPAIVPTSDDDAFIDLASTYTVSINSSVTVNSVSVGAASGTQTLEITAGDQLAVVNASSVLTNGIFALNGNAFGGATLTVGGVFNWNNGSILGSSFLDINAGGTLNINNATAKSLAQRTIRIFAGGTANWNGGAIGMGSGGSIQNLGTFEIKTDNVISGTGTFDNDLTLRKSTTSGTTAFSGVNLDNNGTGTLEVQTGTVSVSGGTSSGAFNISSGAEVLIGTGLYTLDPGASSTGAGKINVNGGTLTVDGNVTSANVAVTSGTLNGSGSLTVSNQFNWSAGDIIDSNGSLVIANTGTATITGASARSLQRDFTNNGGVLLNATGAINHSHSVVSNAGTFDVQSDMVWNNVGFSPTFTNSSNFNKTAGPGTASIGVPFTNTGTMNLGSGTVSIASLTNNATVNLTAGELQLTGTGSTAAAGTYAITGSLQVKMTGGTHTFAGSVTGASGTLQINGAQLTTSGNPSAINIDLLSGTIDGAGTLTVTGSFDWTAGDVLDNAGTLLLTNTSTNTITGPNLRFLSRTFTNNGSLTFTATGSITHSHAAFTNGGTFTAQSDITWNNNGFSPTWVNNGTFAKTAGSGSSSFGTPFTNNLNLNLGSGAVMIFNLTNNSNVNLTAGSLTLPGGGSTSATGSYAISSGLVVDFTGSTHTFAGTFTGSGTARVGGGRLTVTGPSTATNLDFDSGWIDGGGTLTVSDTFDWTGGSLEDNTGALVLGNLSTSTISGTSTKFLLRNVTNNGNLTFTATGPINHSNSVFTNGGTFTLQSDATWNDSGFSPTFVNNSVFTKNGGGGTSTISVGFTNNLTMNLGSGTTAITRLTNNGAVNVTTGLLTMSGNGSTAAAGSYAISSGAIVEMSGGTHTFAGSSTGAGTMQITGAFFSVSGTPSVSNLTFASGNITGGGALTVNGAFSWTGGDIIDNTGSLILSGTSTSTISGGSGRQLQRIFTNNGTLTYTATGTISHSHSAFSNAGTFELQSDASWVDIGFSPSFTNSNLFRKITSPNTSTFSVPFTNNGGTVDLQRGILSTPSGYTQTGTGTLKIHLGGTAAGNDYGQLSAINPTLAGTLEIALIGLYQPVGGDTFRVLAASAHTNDFTQPYTYPALSGGRTFSDAYDASGLLLTVSGQADLSISKSAPSNVIVSSPIAYTITVNNADTDVANSVQVSDTLPAGHTGISASGTGWNCNVVGDTVTCTATSPLPQGNAPNITINATAPATPQSFINTATVSSSNDPNAGNNSGNASVTVDPLQANLDVTTIEPSAPIAPLTSFTFEKIVKNTGPQPATNVTFTAPIPATLTFNSASPDAGSCNLVGSTVTCSLGGILVGNEVHIDINLTSTATTGTQSVTGTAAATETDPDLSNNSVTSSVIVTGSTLTVTTIADSGDGSLRQALLDAATAGVCGPPCTIDFDIQSAPPHEIVILTDLPEVVDQVTLDATTQTGYSGTPIVEINAGLVNSPSANLIIDGNQATVRGFALTAGNNGIYVTGSNNVIEDNYIGLDLGGGPDGHNHGVHIVGGGTNAVRDNVISANAAAGVIIAGSASGNTVTGNKIGTDPNGNADMGNQTGVKIVGTASSNTIGGTTPAEGNLISGNTTNVYVSGDGISFTSKPDGVTPLGAGGANVVSNSIVNNLIGTDAGGNAALDIASQGVVIDDNSANTIIGGSGTGNVISGNANGIVLNGSNNFNTSIEDNLIGVGLDGSTAVGNASNGIVVSNTMNAYIGGFGGVPGAPNTIANNGGDGVNITGNTIAGIVNNSFYNNADLGIDLNGDGATPNDAGDADAGPSGLQNSPTITAVDLLGGGNVRVEYNIDSSATTAASILVELFEADASGEGRTFLTRVCSAGNNFGVGVTFNATGVAVGDPIVATATAFSDGACASIGDGTSEFSNAVLAANCAPPAATINAPPNVCTNSTGNAASVNAPTATGFSWGISNGTITAGQGTANITFTAGATGTVGLTVIVTNTIGCPNTANANVTITPLPTVGITGPNAVCAGSSIVLDAPLGFANYSWSPGGATTPSITVSPSANASYTVTVTDANGCSNTSAPHSVTVNTSPTVAITGSTNTCAGGSVVLDAPLGFASYSWSPGGATTPQITVTPSGDTTYTVTVTDGNGCTGTDSHLVTVSPNPNATISAAPSVCASSTNNNASVPAQVGATYAWNITNGTITSGGTTEAITYTAGATGNVTLNVTVTLGSCSSNGSVNVPINAAPVASITGPANMCEASGPVTLDAGLGFASYVWSPGGATTPSISVSPASTTVYTVLVTNGSGCAATASHTLTVDPLPAVNIAGASATCAGTSVVLDAGSGFASYLWTPGGATTPTITVTPSSDTTYSVSVTDGSGCSASDSHLVTVTSNPTAVINAPASVCASSTNNNASVTQPGASFNWTITGGSITSGQGTGNITFSANASGNVVLGVTVTVGSCTSTGSSTIPINPNPVVAITGPAQVCPNTTFNLDATPGFVSYQWSTTQTGPSISTSQSSGTITYTVVAVDANGCSATASHTVNTTTPPSAAISAPASVQPDSVGNNAAVPLQGGATYNWSISNGSITSGGGTNSIVFTAGSSGNVTLNVTVTASGCASSSTVAVPIGTPAPALNADFSVTKSAATTVQAGATLVYTIVVSNAGPDEAPGTLSDGLPNGVTLTGINGGSWNCSSSNPINCTGTLAAGASNTIVITTTAPQTANTITNTAVLFANDDRNGSNNIATATTLVTGRPTLCATTPPSLLSPANNATVTSPVTFSWSAVEGATLYELWLAGNGLTFLAGSTTGTQTTVQVESGPSAWFVVARLGAGCESLVSARRTFTVQQGSNCAAHAAPQVNTPSGGATTSSIVTVSWTPVPQAIGYRVWAEIDNTAAQDLGTTNGALSLTVNLPPGAIRLFVDALFGGCPPTRSAVVNFTVVAPDPCAERGVATLVSPQNNATLTSSAITFNWNAPADADEARVWASVGGAAPQVLGTTTEQSLKAVVARGEVLWWVELLYDGCSSTESARNRFVIPAAQFCGTSTPGTIAPARNATVGNANVTFQWEGISDAIGYEVWLGPVNGVATLLGTTAANVTSLSSIITAGEHEWFVRAHVDRCVARDSGSSRFTYTPPAACEDNERPTLSSPLDNATIEPPANFSWFPVSGATRFDLYVIRGNNPPAFIASTQSTFMNNVVLAAGDVRWFVRAFFANECSPLDSEIRELEIASPPAACATLVPPVITAPGEISSRVEFLVQWTNSLGATGYQLQVSPNANFSAAETITTTGTAHALTRTNHGTTPLAVYARVRAIDGDCTPLPAVSAFGPTSAIFILPPSPSQGTVQAGDAEVVSYAIPIGPEFAGQSFTAIPTDPWLIAIPASGVVPAGGINIAVTANTDDLDLGANYGAVVITLNSTAGRIGTNATSSVSTPVTVNLVTPVTPAPKNTPPPDALIIPAVANADGINSHFQSDVRLSNTSSKLIKYQLTYVPAGDAGITAGRQTTFSVEPGRTVAIDDVLKTWFGTGTTSAQGSLEIRPLTQTSSSVSSAAIGALANLVSFASSRTFNVTPNGTFGQYIPAVPFANFLGRALDGQTKTVLSLQQIAQSAKYRTNLGLVEGSGEPASLLIKVFGATGQKLTEFPVDLNGGQQTQLNSFLTQKGITLDDGRIEVEVLSGNGKVTAYASVLDNETSDAVLVTPVSLSDAGNTKWVVPGVADLKSGFADWQTDTRIFNAGTDPVEITATFYSQDQAKAPLVNTFTLPAGEVRVLDKTLNTLFGITGDGGALHLSTAKPARLIATARTYNQTSSGTYGQFISAVTPAEAVGLGSRALQLLQVEESARFRTNIGFAEVTGKPVTLEVTITPADAKFTASTTVNLAANEFRQIGGLLKSVLGPKDVFNARVSVRVLSGQGRATAYASVIDLKTNDPTYNPAQ